MLVSNKSQISGKSHTMDLDVTEEQLQRWERGEGFVQDIFPHLTAGEREFILTGITPQEWEEIFGAEDNDDS